MPFRHDMHDTAFEQWLATGPTEDELRDAYLVLEAKRAALWTPGHLDSFRRDRFDLDARYVRQLVQIKQALASQWVTSGQVDSRAIAVNLVA